MADSKEYTYAEVSEHTGKKDLFIVVHDEVFDASSFVDEHPGGEEVMLDVGGQDATEAFEDVGHSDEAREILNGLKIGKLRRVEGDPAPKTSSSTATSTTPKTDAGGMGIGMYVLILVGGALAFFAYQTLVGGSQQKS